MAARPGLAIINTLSKSDGPGDAAEAASWAAAHDLTNVLVWADTDDIIYSDFASQTLIDGGYPFTMVVDADTMTMTYFQPGQISSASSAIQAILDAEHPCADY
ncbi:MAG: hypothetical protein M0R80_21600 [Proteobacteria bacterium]|nr:hypothetical protein [Pseudomonadota bacterium]